MYATFSDSVMSFLWGGASGGQAPAMLVTTVSQKASLVVAGVRDLGSGIQLLVLLFEVL